MQFGRNEKQHLFKTLRKITSLYETCIFSVFYSIKSSCLPSYHPFLHHCHNAFVSEYQPSNVREGLIFGAVVEAKLQKEDSANRTASISARDNRVGVFCL